jgi:hypothetical protein
VDAKLSEIFQQLNWKSLISKLASRNSASLYVTIFSNILLKLFRSEKAR